MTVPPHDRSPGCPFSPEPDPDADPLATAVHHAAYAFLASIGAPLGTVITIKASFEEIEGAPPDEELTARITVGIGPQTQDKIAAEYATDALNREGAPWMN